MEVRVPMPRPNNIGPLVVPAPLAKPLEFMTIDEKKAMVENYKRTVPYHHRALGDVEFRADIDKYVNTSPRAILALHDIEKRTGGDYGQLIDFNAFQDADKDMGEDGNLGSYNWRPIGVLNDQYLQGITINPVETDFLGDLMAQDSSLRESFRKNNIKDIYAKSPWWSTLRHELDHYADDYLFGPLNFAQAPNLNTSKSGPFTYGTASRPDIVNEQMWLASHGYQSAYDPRRREVIITGKRDKFVPEQGPFYDSTTELGSDVQNVQNLITSLEADYAKAEEAAEQKLIEMGFDTRNDIWNKYTNKEINKEEYKKENDKYIDRMLKFGGMNDQQKAMFTEMERYGGNFTSSMRHRNLTPLDVLDDRSTGYADFLYPPEIGDSKTADLLEYENVNIPEGSHAEAIKAIESLALKRLEELGVPRTPTNIRKLSLLDRLGSVLGLRELPKQPRYTY